MKKMHIVIMSMLAAALTAAGVFSIVLWHQNTELKKSQAQLGALLEQAESERDDLKAQIKQLEEAFESESETIAETETVGETEVKLNGKKVAIDPGHQSSSVDMSAMEPLGPGSTEMKAKASTGTTGRYTGVPEYELTLEISKKLRTELEARGYEVVLTREDNDTAISNKERALLAYEEGADIYVRIHANGSEDPSAHGAMTMVPSKNNPFVADLHEESYKLGEKVINAYCAATGMENDGVQLYDNMTGINWSKLPVFILEMGYMTNETDDKNMQSEDYQKKMVTGITDGIDDYFGFEAPDSVSGKGGSDAGGGESAAKADDGTDSALTDAVETLIEPHKAKGERWAVYAAKAGGDVSVLSGSEKMQAASLIKLYIMGAVYENYEALSKNTSEAVLDSLLEKMITVSDNDAANKLTSLLGGGDAAVGRDVVNEFCASHSYDDTSMGRMLLEVNPSGENYTSVTDCGRFLNDVYAGSLSHSEAMLELLKAQQRTGKIPSGVPSGIVTANKTGELSDVENDAAIVYAKNGAYILCVMSEKLFSTADARNVIVEISEKVYESYM